MQKTNFYQGIFENHTYFIEKHYLAILLVKKINFWYNKKYLKNLKKESGYADFIA